MLMPISSRRVLFTSVFASIAALGSVATPALAGRITVASVSASSEYPADGAMSYEAKKVADGKLSTAWVEGEDGAGLGSWVELDLGGEKDVQKIKVWSGIWYSTDYWKRANRAKEIEVSFSDGSKEKLIIPDDMAVFELSLPKARKTSTVRFTLKGAHNGTTWSDTGISEIQVFDSAPDAEVKVAKVTASSVLAPDGDGNYDTANLYDGIADSMWCEADKKSDGTGATLKYDFSTKSRVSQLRLSNGIGSSLAFWMKGHRVASLSLAFDDGSTQELKVKNTMMSQTIAFTPVTTSSVTVTVTGVAAGKEYPDLCISEAVFLE